jgi:hypothetical protein
MQSRLWHADGNVARLKLPRFSAAVDPLHPADGLRELRIEGQPFAGLDLLGVELPGQSLPMAVVDSYVRGGDLIATYPETADRAFRVQIYWRAEPQEVRGAIAAVKLLASVQTSLLETRPRLTTRSVVSAADVFRLENAETGHFVGVAPTLPRTRPPDDSGLPPCHLFRPASADFSYVEMVVPAGTQISRCESAVEGSGVRVRLTHDLFAERLEKGVILRACVIALLVDRRDDLAVAHRNYQAVLSAAPPLTT